MSDRNDDNSKRDEETLEKSSMSYKTTSQVPAKKTAFRSIKLAISSYFSAVQAPLKKPSIDSDFQNLPVIERVTESIKYNILCLEYSISPKGGLRQYLKLIISLLLLFGIPIIVFVPLATYFMSSFANISELLANSTQFLLESALNILKLLSVIILVTSIAYILIKTKIIVKSIKIIDLRIHKKWNRMNEENDFIDVTPGKEQKKMNP